MGLAQTIARRSLWGRPARTFFSVVGVAFGIAIVVGIFALDHNTLIGRGQTGDTWKAEIEIQAPEASVPKDKAGSNREGRDSRDQRQQIEAVEGLEDVTAAFQHQALAWSLNGKGSRDPETRESVHLIAMDAGEGESLSAYRIAEGRDMLPIETPEDGAAEAGTRSNQKDAASKSTDRKKAKPSIRRAPNECLVGKELAKELSLQIGEEMELSRTPRSPRRECVEGEWRDMGQRIQENPRPERFTVVGILERENLGRRGRGMVAIIDYGVGLRLFEGANVQTRYWARRNAEVDLENTEKRLSEAYSYDLKQSVIVGQAADERAFRNGVRFAGLMAMVLGLFVIFYTLSRSLLERMQEVGSLHALGASRSQITRVFLTEACFLSALGGLLGLLGGLGLCWLLLSVGITTLGRTNAVAFHEVPWETVLPLTLAGMGIALLGAIFPLLKAQRISTVAALRGEPMLNSGGDGSAEAQAVSKAQRSFQAFMALLLIAVLPVAYFLIVPVVGEVGGELFGVILLGLGVLALFVCVPLLVPSVLTLAGHRLIAPLADKYPLAGGLAARSVRYGSSRIAGAIAGIALVTAAFVGLRGMTASLQGEVETWGSEAFLHKTYVRHLPPGVEFQALSQALLEYPGVLSVESSDLRHYVPFLLVGLDDKGIAESGPFVQEPKLRRAFRDKQGLILSRRLSDHIDKRVGDEIHVETGAGRVVSLPVVLVSDAYGYSPHPDERLYACIHQEVMADLFCLDITTVENLSVELEPDADPEILRAALADFFTNQQGGEGLPVDKLLAKVVIESGQSIYDWHASDIQRDFVLFDVILLLTAALAGLGMLNGQLLSAMERTKELGVLRALGMDRRQVLGMMLCEAGVVGVLGGILGVLLGGLLSPVIVKALAAVSGLPLVPRGPGWAVLWGLLAALLVALLASLYPVYRINRTSPVAAVRAPG